MAMSTVKCLYRMYTDVRASVWVDHEYTIPFSMVEGVRQGCPISPLVFSLYMDRLEAYLASHVVASLTAREQAALRVVG